jgi:DNA adenine methylase
VTPYTPLRYPGGKGKLAPFVRLLFEHNDLVDGDYAEPYAGGAGVALALLIQEVASHIHINDLSEPIFAFWHSVINETEALCRRIQDTAVTVEEWNRQKAIQRKSKEVGLLDLGFSLFFLNRTNRSGILNGGIIGGKSQAGPWRIDARYNKKELIRRIEKIARYRNRINLYNLDAVKFINTVAPEMPKKSLIYLDPPYYTKGKDLYHHYYGHHDHVEIAAVVSKIQQRWIVSYDNVPEIAELYASYRSQAYGLTYSAAKYYQGSEVMFFCKDLEVPPIAHPTQLELILPTQGQPHHRPTS